MSSLDLAHRGVSGEQDPASTAFRRIGQIAGVVTISVVVFTSLYFFVLYIAS